MKLPVRITAIGALKGRRDCALIRKAAMFAKWSVDDAHFSFAISANESLGRRRPRLIAQLARFRIKKTQPGIQPAFGFFKVRTHTRAPERVAKANPRWRALSSARRLLVW